MSFSLPGCNCRWLTLEKTQFSQFLLTHIADQATRRSSDVRLKSSAKCSHNIGIANMRAEPKINDRQIAIRFHRLFGRSKKEMTNHGALSL